MNKVDFLNTVNDCIVLKEIKFLVVAVEGVAEKEELIINPRENFVQKRDYYDKTYNENMELIHNNKIKITFVEGLTSLSELTR